MKWPPDKFAMRITTWQPCTAGASETANGVKRGDVVTDKLRLELPAATLLPEFWVCRARNVKYR